MTIFRLLNVVLVFVCANTGSFAVGSAGRISPKLSNFPDAFKDAVARRHERPQGLSSLSSSCPPLPDVLSHLKSAGFPLDEVPEEVLFAELERLARAPAGDISKYAFRVLGLLAHQFWEDGRVSNGVRFFTASLVREKVVPLFLDTFRRARHFPEFSWQKLYRVTEGLLRLWGSFPTGPKHLEQQEFEMKIDIEQTVLVAYRDWIRADFSLGVVRSLIEDSRIVSSVQEFGGGYDAVGLAEEPVTVSSEQADADVVDYASAPSRSSEVPAVWTKLLEEWVERRVLADERSAQSAGPPQTVVRDFVEFPRIWEAGCGNPESSLYILWPPRIQFLEELLHDSVDVAPRSVGSQAGTQQSGEQQQDLPEPGRTTSGEQELRADGRAGDPLQGRSQGLLVLSDVGMSSDRALTPPDVRHAKLPGHLQVVELGLNHSEPNMEIATRLAAMEIHQETGNNDGIFDIITMSKVLCHCATEHLVIPEAAPNRLCGGFLHLHTPSEAKASNTDFYTSCGGISALLEQVPDATLSPAPLRRFLTQLVALLRPGGILRLDQPMARSQPILDSAEEDKSSGDSSPLLDETNGLFVGRLNWQIKTHPLSTASVSSNIFFTLVHLAPNYITQHTTHIALKRQCYSHCMRYLSPVLTLWN